MKEKVIRAIHERAQALNEAWLYSDKRVLNGEEARALAIEKEVFSRRHAVVVHTKTTGDLMSVCTYGQQVQVDYALFMERFIVQQETRYIEERLWQRRALFIAGKWKTDTLLSTETTGKASRKKISMPLLVDDVSRVKKGSYDRREAVRYAERWWHVDPPLFRHEKGGSAHFVSQCLYAGGAPMTCPTREQGWWCHDNVCGDSWIDPHLLRWYLSGAKTGLRGEMRSQAHDLIPGDVICYDFNGDGVWDHIAFVVAKDCQGEPLVNAHDIHSRMRYWTYEDAIAYTESVQYVFFHIVVD